MRICSWRCASRRSLQCIIDTGTSTPPDLTRHDHPQERSGGPYRNTDSNDEVTRCQRIRERLVSITAFRVVYPGALATAHRIACFIPYYRDADSYMS